MTTRWLLAFGAVAFTCSGALADPGGDFNGLLVEGEQALRANDSSAAVRAYERASALRHEAVAEWGLVRSWMQAGEYRRALAFSAHAAGAHPDVAEGAGLYAWLLHIGGQPAIAQQTLDAAMQREPDNPLLKATAERLRNPATAADPRLLEGATRQAPHAALVLPALARAVGSGLLLPDGRHALVPADAMANDATLWLRNAQGRTVAARLSRGVPELGLAELVLDEPLQEAAEALAVAPRDAFPGSPQMAVEFAASPEAPAAPGWPLLHIGFVGRWQVANVYTLGAELVSGGPHAGPVYDRAGQLIGVVRQGGDGQPALLAASALRAAWPRAFAVSAAVAAPMSPDVVYERAMRSVVQLIVLPSNAAMR